jgi:hypothetical protein
MSIKVKELLEILKNVNPETKILVRLDGSIFPTDNLDEHLDYNHDITDSNGEYYILALEEFENDNDWVTL